MSRHTIATAALAAAIALAASVALGGCGAPGSEDESSPVAPVAPSPSVSVDPHPEITKAVTAQVFGVSSALMWASDGRPVPLIITDDAYTVGNVTVPLEYPGMEVQLYGTHLAYCMEGRVEVEGKLYLASIKGQDGSFAAVPEPGKRCAEVSPALEAVQIPQENFPGLNRFDQILETTGTCVDFVFADFAGLEPEELALVVDCAGAHEYVLVDVPALTIPLDATDKAIEDASADLCGDAVDAWSVANGRDYLYSYYWFPTSVGYKEGDAGVSCFAQVAEDVEQNVDPDSLYPTY